MVAFHRLSGSPKKGGYPQTDPDRFVWPESHQKGRGFTEHALVAGKGGTAKV